MADPIENDDVVDQQDDKIDATTGVVDTSSVEGFVDALLANEKTETAKQETKPAATDKAVASAARDGGNQPQRTPVGNTVPIKGMQGYATDAAGNIVDFAGRIVAREGAERRKWEQATPFMRGITDELYKTKTQLEAYEKANAAALKANLTPAEIGSGFQLIAAWKADPVKTIEHLLTTARENGHDVSRLVGGQANAGLDMNAIRSLLTEEIGKVIEPFKFVINDREAAQKDRQLQQEVNTSVDEFFNDFPNARHHEDVLAQMIVESGYRIDMHKAWAMLADHAAQNGLDITKPLRPQVAARTQTGRTQPRNTPRDMPNARGAATGARTNASRVADANDSYDSIIREVVQEIGRG